MTWGWLVYKQLVGWKKAQFKTTTRVLLSSKTMNIKDPRVMAAYTEIMGVIIVNFLWFAKLYQYKQNTKKTLYADL